MTLRPFMALWPYGSVVLWLHGLAHPGASLGHGFMTFSGVSRLFCPPTLSLDEFQPKTLWVCILSLGLSTIKVGDVRSMLMEICRIVPKWSPAPVPAPPCPGLTFPDFRDFSDFFAHRPCPLVSFDPKLCVIVEHH